MAWNKGFQPEVLNSKNGIISEIKELDGKEFTDEEARKYLSKLFLEMPGFFWYIMTRNKFKIHHFQELIIKAWFKKDNCLIVGGRGVSKSYSIAVFCLIYSIFNPNVKIVLVANVFRSVKRIFDQMEKFLKPDDCKLLKQAFLNREGKLAISRAPDRLTLRCGNGAEITGLPLSGENLRGERANVLIIDEGLLISEHVQESILRPFLTAALDSKEYEEIKKREDFLIKMKKMTPEERTPRPKNKLIITSSASYQFEYLYNGIYLPYVKLILDEHKKRGMDDPSYFAMRLSYKGVPKETILDESVLKAAAEGREHSAVFKREYCAIFADASDSYFDIKKMHECTYPDGERPTVQIRGNPKSKYLLTIDPSYDSSKASDFFAMGVYLLVPEERKIVQVHTYGQPGKDVKEHYEYLVYLLKNFNIEMLGIDASGTEFIDSFNNSTIAAQYNIKLNYITAPLDEWEGPEYQAALKQAKNQLNVETSRIVYPLQFSASHNRRMNEYLQGGISAKKVWFGSQICKDEISYNEAINFKLPFEFKDQEGEPYTISTFLDNQDDWIEETKRQLAYIELKITENGTHQYVMPNNLRRSKDPKRARRDNYTTILMGYTLSKYYYDIINLEDDKGSTGFVPFFC